MALTIIPNANVGVTPTPDGQFQIVITDNDDGRQIVIPFNKDPLLALAARLREVGMGTGLHVAGAHEMPEGDPGGSSNSTG